MCLWSTSWSWWVLRYFRFLLSKKYIAELKKAKKLCKKHSINKYDGYGHKKFYYKCTKCRSVWALTEPDGNFNGRLEKL